MHFLLKFLCSLYIPNPAAAIPKTQGFNSIVLALVAKLNPSTPLVAAPAPAATVFVTSAATLAFFVIPKKADNLGLNPIKKVSAADVPFITLVNGLKATIPIATIVSIFLAA